jgi:CBS domain-containing protein
LPPPGGWWGIAARGIPQAAAGSEGAMKVKDIMTRGVQLAAPDESIRDAARKMGEIDAGILPVGENDRLVGMISDRDIAIRGIGAGMGPDTKVRELMSEEVLYCFDDQEIEEVAANMGDVQVRRLPVVDRDKRLVGILSLADLAQAERGQRVGNALRQIAQPGGEHTQGANERSGGM